MFTDIVVFIHIERSFGVFVLKIKINTSFGWINAISLISYNSVNHEIALYGGKFYVVYGIKSYFLLCIHSCIVYRKLAWTKKSDCICFRRISNSRVTIRLRKVRFTIRFGEISWASKFAFMYFFFNIK